MSASLILVDSSVWIDYYRPSGPMTLKHRLQKEVANGTVATLGLIVVEVLQGAPTPSIFSSLQEDFLGLHWLDVTRQVWLEAAQLSVQARRAGWLTPTTDVVIAATAIHYRCHLWHRDTDFTRLARHASALHAVAIS